MGLSAILLAVLPVLASLDGSMEESNGALPRIVASVVFEPSADEPIILKPQNNLLVPLIHGETNRGGGWLSRDGEALRFDASLVESGGSFPGDGSECPAFVPWGFFDKRAPPVCRIAQL